MPKQTLLYRDSPRILTAQKTLLERQSPRHDNRLVRMDFYDVLVDLRVQNAWDEAGSDAWKFG